MPYLLLLTRPRKVVERSRLLCSRQPHNEEQRARPVVAEKAISGHGAGLVGVRFKARSCGAFAALSPKPYIAPCSRKKPSSKNLIALLFSCKANLRRSVRQCSSSVETSRRCWLRGASVEGGFRGLEIIGFRGNAGLSVASRLLQPYAGGHVRCLARFAGAVIFRTSGLLLFLKLLNFLNWFALLTSQSLEQ